MQKLAQFIINTFIFFTHYAQNVLSYIDRKSTIKGFCLDYCFIIRHSENLREIDEAYPYGIDLDWSKLILTKKAWEICNCFPRVGLM